MKDCFQTAAVIKQLHGFAFITEPAVYRTQTENTVAYARTGSIMLFLSPAQLVFRASTPDCKCLAGGESERPLARKVLPSQELCETGKSIWNVSVQNISKL